MVITLKYFKDKGDVTKSNHCAAKGQQSNHCAAKGQQSNHCAAKGQQSNNINSC